MVCPIAKFGSIWDLGDSLDFEGLRFSQAHADTVLAQVGEALRHMHDNGFEHNDLSARNVLVFDFDANCTARTHVRLADFGETTYVDLPRAAFVNDARAWPILKHEVESLVCTARTN